MKIICISGKAQHGKDTSAIFMKEALERRGNRVLIAHFADTLKYICKTFFNWNGEKDEAGRELLQYVGTDVIRKKKPSYWVDFIKSVLELFADEWDYVLLADCRFPNELEDFKLGGFDAILVRVDRKNFTSPLSAEQQQHISETAMDGYPHDYFLPNDGDLDALECEACVLVSKIVGEGHD